MPTSHFFLQFINPQKILIRLLISRRIVIMRPSKRRYIMAELLMTRYEREQGCDYPVFYGPSAMFPCTLREN